MKAKSTIISIVLLFCSSLATADDESHKAAAEELLLLSNHDKVMEQVWGQIEGMVEQQFLQMDAPESCRPILKKYTNKMFKVLAEEMSFAHMKNDLIEIYVNTYTEDEIRAISDFYKSPTGRTFLEKMPKLMQESMIVTQRNMPRMMKEIQAIRTEMREEIKKSMEQE